MVNCSKCGKAITFWDKCSDDTHKNLCPECWDILNKSQKIKKENIEKAIIKNKDNPLLETNEPKEKQVNTKTISVIIGLIAGGIFGYYASQYFPFWGGLIGMFGQPYSEARMSLMPGHVLVFAVAGGLCGFVYKKYVASK